MNLKEQVTPHKLSLLVLIKEYCLMRKRIRNPDTGAPVGPVLPGTTVPAGLTSAPPGPDTTDTPGVMFVTAQSPSPLEAADHVLVEKCDPQVTMETDFSPKPADDSPVTLTESEMTKFMVAILKLIQSPDLDPANFLIEMSSFCPESLSTLFLQKLTEIHDGGLQSLMNFFQHIASDFFTEPEPLVQRTSVVGLLVRRLALCFEALSFSQVTKLYCAFKVYFKGLRTVSGEDNKMEDNSAMEESMESMNMDCTADVTLPDPVVNTGSKLLQRYSQRQAEFFILQQSNYLQYNPGKAMSPGQLQEKIKHLLQSNPSLADAHYLSYLNHLRVDEYCGALHSLYHYFDRNQFKRREEKDEEGFKGYRYAILNLATLHFRFGHREEALLALKEAMSVAQEYNDNVCLQHALSWFHRLGEEMPPPGIRNLDKNAGSDSHLSYLTSLNVQLMAKRIAAEGLNPAHVFDHIMKSDWVNCQQNLTDLNEISLAQKSALWTMYGNRLLPTLYCQMALNLYGSENGVPIDGEATTIAKCTVARALADVGRFPASSAILDSCASENSPHNSVVKLTSLLIQFDDQMHQSRVQTLWEIVLKINGIDRLEGQLREAIYLKEVGDTEKSYQILTSLKDRDLSEYPGLACRVTLAYTELCCQIGQPTGALDSLLSCLVFCQHNHLVYYHALTAMYLAFVQFCLNLPDQALILIERNLVSLLNLGSNYDKARCLYLYAKCRVSAANKDNTSKRRQILVKVTQILNKCASLFESVGNSRRVKDVYYYQARLYHELGLISERNKYAIEFRKLDSLYPTLTQMTVNIL